MEGVIVDMEIGDPVQIWFRRLNGPMDKINYNFKPVIYVEHRHFDKLKYFLSPKQVDYIESVVKRVNPKGTRKRLIEITFKNYTSFNFFRKNMKGLFIPVYNMEMYIEQQFLRVPTLNLIDLKIGEKVNGIYLGAMDPSPPPLNIGMIRWEGNLGPILKVNGENIILKDSLIPEVLKVLKREKVDLLICEKLDQLKKLYPKLFNSHGRLTVDVKDFIGLAALSEKAYFTFLSPRKVLDLTIGNSVDARQSYFALKLNWALPIKNNSNAFLDSAKKYYEIDKGGLIVAPDPGIYFNVAAIDFVSMFPNLILKFNISYETCKPDGIIKTNQKGFLPLITEEPLKRRMYFRKIRHSDPWAMERYKILKLLLVAIYGYSGKLDNRFGNALCNMYINKFSRMIVEKSIKIAENHGFKVIYGDTDSIFVTKEKMNREDVERLTNILRKATGLPMDVENYYKYIAFPPSRTRKGSALKRYFGVTNDGRIVVKGIMAVKRDTPKIIKDAQIEMIQTLSKVENGKQLTKILDIIGRIYKKYKNRILTGKVAREELAIEKKLGKDPWDYKTTQPHIIASRKLNARKGETVKYIILSSRSSNPNNKIILIEEYRGVFDKSKYVELLKEAYREIILTIKDGIENEKRLKSL